MTKSYYTADKTSKQNTNYCLKTISEFLNDHCSSSIFIQPNEKNERGNSIPFANVNKALDVNSMP